MEQTKQQQGAALDAKQPTAPTMGDFNRYLADAVREWGTDTRDGVVNDEATAIATLCGLANLADYMPVSANRLCDLMDVVHAYALTSQTDQQRKKADHAHEALTRLITLHMNFAEVRQELTCLESAVERYAEANTAFALAEYRRTEDATAGTIAKKGGRK